MGRPKKRISQENIQNFQRELEMAGDNAEKLLTDKRGRSRSCLLCRRRKQRCDRKQPSCSNCLKAKVKCIQPVRYNPNNAVPGITPSPLPSFDEATPKCFRPNVVPKLQDEQYTKYLESRVHALEEALNKNKNSVQLPVPNSNETNPENGPNGTPSGANGRVNLFHKGSPFSNGMPSKETGPALPALASDSLESIDFSKCIFAKYNLKEFMNYDPVFEFDGILSRSFLDTFFTRLQFKYPLLDEQEIYDFHADYISNDIHSYSETDFHFACGRMWLVFSISACLYMTTGKYKGLPPVRYFSTAIRHITRCGQSLNNVQRVELLTLLVLYMLRTDRDSSVLYEIIKDVMFICKSKLGLNHLQPNDPYADKRLRIFWCVYLLERMICVAVGRPFTISESEINLPLFSEGSFYTAPSKQPDKSSSSSRGTHFINQSLRLRRIESQFVEQLQILPLKHNKKEVLRGQLPMVKKFFQDLEVWRAGCSKDNIKNFENETLKLYYYRSVRLLLQPYLEFMKPEDKLFRECQAAAGQICQLYKIFHQKTLTGHSTPAIHTVFIAGVTLIYCMWLARNNDDERRKKLGDASKHTRPLVSASLFSTMDDLRACSVCLYVMTERSNFARTFRDTFDQLMNATVGNLIERCGPDSSELIYLSHKEKSLDSLEIQSASSHDTNDSESGMPPATERTFGKRQAEEHVGFVEISQVDIEEQEEFKRKRGMLEQMSVPKSLSHLLIKVEDDKEPKTSNEKPNHPVHGASKDKYIVKKPTNSTEFDWKSFQQQALVQQHVARENLKAYLSSLNYINGCKSVPISPEPHIYTPPEIQPSNVARNNNVPTETGPPQVGMMNKDEKAGMNHPYNIPRENAAPVARMLPHLATGPTSASNSPSSMLNTGLLFNNGTHDMINDISTWTNDSVMNLMENESLKFQPQDNFSFLPHDDERFLPQIKQATPNQSPHTNGPQFSAAEVNPQGKAPNMTGPGSNQARNDNDTVRRPHLHPSATGHNSMVERFWTVNDDYGFLT